jgi:hypothetical protein
MCALGGIPWKCRYCNIQSPSLEINTRETRSGKMLKEIALDLRRYDTPEKLGSLINDTASLSIEASETDIPRVNPSYFVKKSDSYVIAPGRDKRDVNEMFVENDESTKAANKIREMLLADTKNNAYVWISPSGEWPESRIQVGIKKTTKSGRFDYLKRYDISTTISPEKCLLLGQLLASMTDDVDFPTKPNDMRRTIFKLNIPGETDPFSFLSGLIELPENNRWKSILDGSADKNKAKAVKAAVVATKPVLRDPRVIYSSPMEYGAYIETRMRYEGFGMNPDRFGCGASNVVSTTSVLSYSETSTPNYGYELMLGSFACPKCNGLIPSGLGITTCPHCGITKEQAGSTCG